MPGTHRPARTAGLVLGAVLATLLAQPAPSAATAAEPATWTRVSARLSDHRPHTVNPRAFAAYRLDRTGLLEELGTGRVAVPDPDGDLVSFRVEPTSVLEPGLAAAHPELRTWAGTAVTGPGSIRLDLTPAGLHASVRGDGGAWHVDPAYRDGDSLHLTYAGAALPAPEHGLVEPTLPRRTAEQLAARAEANSDLGEGPGASVQLRTYRLALLSDPSYAAYTLPSPASNTASDNAVLAAKTTLVNRLNQLYGDDLGIRLVLVNGTDTRLNLWTTAEAQQANGPCGQSPCYPPGLLAAGCELPLLDRNRWVIGQIVGARNYDVGHLALGIPGGGLAYLDSAGRPTKAGGCTGLAAPSGDQYAVDFLAHELGHQLGADHTFEGTGGGCAGNRFADTAVEPGSGSTVMAYAGTCGADDLQDHTDPVFSAVSRDAVDDYVTEPPDSVSEWQSVALTGFDGTDSFRLQVGSAVTGILARGSTYTASGIKSALTAVLPAGTSVQVRPFFDEFGFDDRGFALYFVLYGGAFAVDVPEATVLPVAGQFTSAVNDIDAGNPSASSGGTVTTTSNHNPTVSAPVDRTIPIRTPFSLTGSATDSDGNALGYFWEQTDVGGGPDGVALSTQPRTAGPLFRVFGTASSTFANTPTASGATRSFPDLAQVVAGHTNADTGSCPAGAGRLDCLSEWLPTAAYTGSALHFRLSARDGSAPGGGTDSDDVVLTLDKASGPFRVTSQTASTTLPGGSGQTVTWTANTSALAANVRITLSTDGGATFPVVLAASTPNDGSADVTLPDVGAGSARIRVEAVGNYFYDVNDASFAIQPSGGPAPLVVDHSSVPATWNVQFSDPATTSFSASTGLGTSQLSASVAGLPAGLTLSPKTGNPPSGGSWTISGSLTAAPGSYPAHVTVTDGDASDGFDVTVVVAAEDSTVTFTGPADFLGPDEVTADIPVTLTSQVTQAADGTPGPLGAATVRFTDTATGHVLCAAAPVTATGVGPGTASCSFVAHLGDALAVVYTVGLTVGGPFRGSSASDTTVTVEIGEEPEPVPPETTITSGPSGWLLATTATFGFASSTPGSDFVCRLDGARVPCEAPRVTVTGLGQYGHRFQVYAEDQSGEFDESPAIRDFAVPIDDRGLRPSERWKRKKSASAYLGTCSQARKKGVALTYRVHDARELALIVRTGKRYGAVKVFLDKELLAKVRTAGKKGSRMIRLGHFAEPRSGTIRIVTTTGRTVLVDGLGVSARPF